MGSDMSCAAGLESCLRQGLSHRVVAKPATAGAQQQQARVFGGWGGGAKSAEANDDIACVIVDREPAFGVQLAQRYSQCPLIWADRVEAIRCEVTALAYAHAGGAQQQQGIGNDVVLRVQVSMQEIVIRKREGFGKVDLRWRQIVTADQFS